MRVDWTSYSGLPDPCRYPKGELGYCAGARRVEPVGGTIQMAAGESCPVCQEIVLNYMAASHGNSWGNEVKVARVRLGGARNSSGTT